MEGIIRLIDYGSLNVGFVPLTTQQRGACLFHAFRRCIPCPREFTNSHLRRMLVAFICNRAEELYPMLVCAISGSNGHIRLSADEYKKKMDRNQLTGKERQKYSEPGPFSIVTYCEALLNPTLYGEELCLILLSMLFKVITAVLDGDSLIGIKVRHQNTALNADAILVHVSRCHYITLGKSCYLLSLLYFQPFIQTAHNENALRCIKFNPDCTAIYLQCIEIDTIQYIWYNLLSVEEFDEEVDGGVHHQHRLLSCLDLTTAGQ